MKVDMKFEGAGARIQQDFDHPSRNPHNSLCDHSSTHRREQTSVPLGRYWLNEH
jgi:hypothetical protein